MIMKTYSELCFFGTENQILKFKKDIPKYVTSDWRYKTDKNAITEYLTFTYVGENEENAMVCICDSKYNGEPCYRIVNIVPINTDELSMEQYNHLVKLFYEDIVVKYEEFHQDIRIEGPTSDVFDPCDVITETALKKLKSFCNMANKSTGSSHPCDQQRWFEFICQTIDDDRTFDYDTLANFLQDETYWGSKKDAGIGVMGQFAWSPDKAYELAAEYEAACNILKYYKETRG